MNRPIWAHSSFLSFVHWFAAPAIRTPVFKLVLAGLLVVQLGACASGISRSENPVLAKPYFADNGIKAGSLTLTMTEEARKLAAENLSFSHDQLLSTVRRALELNKIVTKDADPKLPAIQIEVTSVNVRSNFSAVMFGFFAGDDHIKGNLMVRRPDGKVVQRFGVSASYALGGLAGGQDSTRMSWLYEAFAKRVIEELTGKTPPDDVEKPKAAESSS